MESGYIYEHPKKHENLQSIDHDIKSLKNERRSVERDQNNDPDVIENAADGTHPSVSHYAKELSKIDKKLDLLNEKRAKYADNHVEGDIVPKQLMDAWNRMNTKKQ